MSAIVNPEVYWSRPCWTRPLHDPGPCPDIQAWRFEARVLASTCQSAGSADRAVAASFPAPQSAAGSAAEGARGLTASQPVRQGADAFPVDTASSVVTPREEDRRHESAARTADRQLHGHRQSAAGALSQGRREYGGHWARLGPCLLRGADAAWCTAASSTAATMDPASQSAAGSAVDRRRGSAPSRAPAQREADTWYTAA